MTEPATAMEARTTLDARIADKDFGARVLAGDADAKRELDVLHAKIHAGGDDVVEAALSGALGDMPSSDMRAMAGTAELFRELGIRDEVTREFLSGKGVTAHEYELVENWKKIAMGDRKPGGFVERYLAGDTEAMNKMTLANSVLVNGVKKEAA